MEIDGHFEAEEKHEKPIQVLFCISYNKAANWFQFCEKMNKLLQLALRFCSVEMALTLHCKAPKATTSLPGACKEIPTDVGPSSAPRGAHQGIEEELGDVKLMHLPRNSIPQSETYPEIV